MASKWRTPMWEMHPTWERAGERHYAIVRVKDVPGYRPAPQLEGCMVIGCRPTREERSDA